MKKFILSTSILLPGMSFALGSNIREISRNIAAFLGKPLMTLLFTAALAMFLWGVVDFIRNAENSEAREKGKQRMLWGIIALFVMVAFLGLTGVITGTLFGKNPLLPQLYE